MEDEITSIKLKNREYKLYGPQFIKKIFWAMNEAAETKHIE
jgi:hypothetical protein